jgi:hypothetical protein
LTFSVSAESARFMPAARENLPICRQLHIRFIIERNYGNPGAAYLIHYDRNYVSIR